MVGEEQTASADAVRAELQRILASPHFDASERNRNFLAYVVEEALAGRAERIKAYAIATAVFGRDEGFDPQLDSIVRIEAGRLRRSLERYYLTDGRASHLRIDIPRGGYVPVFGRTDPRRSGAGLRTARPQVLVTAFEEEGDQSAFPSFTRGFTRSLIIALTRFTGLRVFGAETAFRRPADVDPQAAGRDLAADYIVTGQTSLLPGPLRGGRPPRRGGDRPRRLGRDLRAHACTRPRSSRSATRWRTGSRGRWRSHTARSRATGRATPTGRRPRRSAATRRSCSSTPTGGPSTAEMIEAVRIGLERAVATEPDYAEAHACLSLVYSNAFRFRHPIGATEPDPRERALSLAARAVELAPNSSWARYALGLARWFSGNVAGALDALEAGRALNPNDTTILADLGQRYAMLARWDEAVPLLEESYATNPSQPGSYRIGLFLYHFAHGRFAEALGEARRVDAPQVLYGHVAVAAAAAELGLHDEAAKAVAAIRALDPDYGAHVVADLEGRHVAPELIPLLVAGLAKAGLAVAGRTSAGRRRTGPS